MSNFDFLDEPQARPAYRITKHRTPPAANHLPWIISGIAAAACLLGGILFAIRSKDLTVSGELFFKTKGGDTKKAGGETVYLTPFTPEFQKRITAQIVRAIDGGESWSDAQAETLLKKNSNSVIANADGQFSIAAPEGQYLLWTTTHTIMESRFFWAKVISVSGPVHLELGSDSTVDCPGDSQSLWVCVTLAIDHGWVKSEKVSAWLSKPKTDRTIADQPTKVAKSEPTKSRTVGFGLRPAPEYQEPPAGGGDPDLSTFSGVTAEALCDAYRANGVRAEEAYRNRGVRVVGVVTRIGKDGGEASVALGDAAGSAGCTVICTFDDNRQGLLEQLQRGDVIAVAGTVDTAVAGVVFVRHCFDVMKK